MGLGGYLAGQTDVEHYEAERKREERETVELPDVEAEEVASILRDFGLEEPQVPPVVDAMRKNPAKWVDFMMRFELGLEAPDPRRAMQSAVTIALSYAISGFIPLGPYILVHSVTSALYLSVAVTLLALFVFGYVKGRVTGISALRSGWQTMLIGGVAAGAAFGIARLI
jgi:VIT1/CCC1 family predicted Fe2+/Mn2+ transporter